MAGVALQQHEFKHHTVASTETLQEHYQIITIVEIIAAKVHSNQLAQHG